MYAAGARRARPMDGPSKTAKRTVVQTVTSATDQHCHNYQHFAFERERTGAHSCRSKNVRPGARRARARMALVNYPG